jgi:hypothetical protein
VYAGCGTIFKISPTGKFTFTMLHVFSAGTGGEYPVGGLIQAPDGKLYGTTQNGGDFNTITCWNACGTVFKIGLSGGALTKMASFGSGDGWLPAAGLTLGPDLLLYGATPTGDTGFQLGWVFAFVPAHPFKLH